MKRIWWKSGFVLLEVMVVAAFVSSVSFTAYQVMRKGNEAVCQNNLHQIYLALVDFQMNNGSLPNAIFFPSSPDDKKGINSLLKDNLSSNKTVFFCPVIPSELNKRGTNYLWNDAVNGKNLDGIPGSTWLLTEVTAISSDTPAPHTRGYQILHADGTVSVGPRINFPAAAPSPKQPVPGLAEQNPEPELAVELAKRPIKIRVENLPEKIVAGKLRMKIIGYDEFEKIVPVDKTVSVASVNDSIQPETVVLSKGIWEGDMSFSRSIGVDTVLVVDEDGDFYFAKVDVVPGPPGKIEILLPKNDLKAGESFEVEVLVQDEFGNICRFDDSGNWNLECSDSNAQITPIDLDRMGSGWNEKFKLVVFKAGNQKIKVTLRRNSDDEIVGEKALVINPGAVDHFTIDRINSPKIAGESFKVIICSEDRWGNMVKGPDLSDTTGTLIVSRKSSISGVREEEVLVTKASKEIFLVVEDGNNHSGKSNPFEVKPAVPADIGLGGIPRVVTAGREYKLKVIFSDRYGNEIPEYTGGIEFTSSDRNFRSSGEFLVTFDTPGKQILTVKDKKTGLASNWTVVVIR